MVINLVDAIYDSVDLYMAVMTLEISKEGNPYTANNTNLIIILFCN